MHGPSQSLFGLARKETRGTTTCAAASIGKQSFRNWYSLQNSRHRDRVSAVLMLDVTNA